MCSSSGQFTSNYANDLRNDGLMMCEQQEEKEKEKRKIGTKKKKRGKKFCYF